MGMSFTLLNLSKPPSVSLMVLAHSSTTWYLCFKTSRWGSSQGSSWITPIFFVRIGIISENTNNFKLTCAICGNVGAVNGRRHIWWGELGEELGSGEKMVQIKEIQRGDLSTCDINPSTLCPSGFLTCSF